MKTMKTMYKTVTVLMEVSRPEIQPDFHCPGADFRAYPRTRDGVKNALRRLERAAQSLPGVMDYRAKLYEGHKDASNVRPFIGSLTPCQIRAFYRGEV